MACKIVRKATLHEVVHQIELVQLTASLLTHPEPEGDLSIQVLSGGKDYVVGCEIIRGWCLIPEDFDERIAAAVEARRRKRAASRRSFRTTGLGRPRHGVGVRKMERIVTCEELSNHIDGVRERAKKRTLIAPTSARRLPPRVRA
jgi:hypothetical protein